MVEAERRCTGITASWCPIHGDCACGEPGRVLSGVELNNPACPLHALDSPHAAHLPGCIPARPGDASCAEVRALFGACPDHDAYCEPGCPVGPEPGGAQYAGVLDEGREANIVNRRVSPRFL